MYKDIIVFLNEAEGRDKVIQVAAKFANEVNAHLIGVYVRPSIFHKAPAYSLMSDEMIKELSTQDDEIVSKAKEDFFSLTDMFSCPREWHEVYEHENPCRHTAYADIIITNHYAYDPSRGESNLGLINKLILETSKPLILIPEDIEESKFGSKIVIGWDESKEAIRAVQDAIPLLQKADSVDVVSVTYEGDEPADISEISNYLSRRNVENNFHLKVTDNALSTPEKVLLDHAYRVDADLLVLGGYGHSRLREMILGGTTRYLIKNSDIPVLFSH